MPRKQSVFAEVGQIFGRLTVVETGRHPKSSRPAARVVCRGSADQPHDPVEKWVNVLHLAKGTTASCGCLQREAVRAGASDNPQAVRMREWRDRRNSPDYQPVQRWRSDENGRECSYSGRGNCGHAYKLWHEFSPGEGPRGHETRCKACMATRAAEYMGNEPSDVQLRRAERQRAYAKTPAGRAANRRARLAYRYGITAAQYESMEEQQGGLCYFCGFEETVNHHASGKLMNLAVDHDHACGRGHDPKKGCPACVRGLACYNCNIFIERAERSPVLRPRIEDLLARRPLAGTVD